MSTPKVLESRVRGQEFGTPGHPRVEPLTVRSILKNGQFATHCVSADVASLDALRSMAEHNVSAVLVLDDGRPGGIFSHRDYAAASAQFGPSAATKPVSLTMAPCKFVVTPADSAQKCLQLMHDNHLHYLPIQDKDEFLALLTLEDLLNELVTHYGKIFKEYALDQQLLFLRGTYSC